MFHRFLQLQKYMHGQWRVHVEVAVGSGFAVAVGTGVGVALGVGCTVGVKELCTAISIAGD